MGHGRNVNTVFNFARTGFRTVIRKRGRRMGEVEQQDEMEDQVSLSSIRKFNRY